MFLYTCVNKVKETCFVTLFGIHGLNCQLNFAIWIHGQFAKERIDSRLKYAVMFK